MTIHNLLGIGFFDSGAFLQRYSFVNATVRARPVERDATSDVPADLQIICVANLCTACSVDPEFTNIALEGILPCCHLFETLSTLVFRTLYLHDCL